MSFFPIGDAYRAYLEDESGLKGFADGIAFPESARDLAAVLKEAEIKKQPVTIQGARTGLCGGAVPEGGLIVSLEKMNAVLELSEKEGQQLLRVQAGAALVQIEDRARSLGLFFPPDPTEKSATIGGVLAAGGAGPSSLRYGATSRYVEALTLVTYKGEIREIKRGEHVFDGGGCRLPDGGWLNGARAGLDLIDYLYGGEGAHGVFAELELVLLPLPEHIWGVVYFFPSLENALAFLEPLQEWAVRGRHILQCAECFDSGALGLLRREKDKNALLKAIPALPGDAGFALYIELAGSDPDALDAALGEHLDLFSAAGGSDGDTWAESGYSAIKRLRDMRHAVAEIIGSATGCPDGSSCRTRLETDFSGPPEKTGPYLSMYTGDAKAAGIGCAVYGHVLQNRLHAALLYRSPEEKAAGEKLISRWAKTVRADGGLLISENGAGKLKTGFIDDLLTS